MIVINILSSITYSSSCTSLCKIMSVCDCRIRIIVVILLYFFILFVHFEQLLLVFLFMLLVDAFAEFILHCFNLELVKFQKELQDIH